MGKNNQYFRPYEVSCGTAILQEKDVVSINPNVGGLSITYDFYNNLDYPVTVGFCDGVRITIKPMNDNTKPQRFYINKYIKMGKYYTVLHLPDTTTHPEHTVTANNYIHGALNRHESNMQGSSDIVVEQYCVDSEELRRMSSLYLSNLDIVVSVEALSAWHHPRSPDGVFRQKITETHGVNRDDMFGLSIELICAHSSGESERFVNLANNIFRVPVKYQYDRKPGLYITYNGKTTKEHPPSPPQVEYFEWKDEDKFPVKLFNTWYDALNLGDIETERKKEIAQLKHEIERLQMENKQFQAESEKESSYRKEVFSELEQMRKERQHEMEMKSMDRKDSSDFMKWLPIIINSVVALITITVKLSSSNK